MTREWPENAQRIRLGRRMALKWPEIDQATAKEWPENGKRGENGQRKARE